MNTFTEEINLKKDGMADYFLKIFCRDTRKRVIETIKKETSTDSKDFMKMVRALFGDKINVNLKGKVYYTEIITQAGVEDAIKYFLHNQPKAIYLATIESLTKENISIADDFIMNHLISYPGVLSSPDFRMIDSVIHKTDIYDTYFVSCENARIRYLLAEKENENISEILINDTDEEVKLQACLCKKEWTMDYVVNVDDMCIKNHKLTWNKISQKAQRSEWFSDYSFVLQMAKFAKLIEEKLEIMDYLNSEDAKLLFKDEKSVLIQKRLKKMIY